MCTDHPLYHSLDLPSDVPTYPKLIYLTLRAELANSELTADPCRANPHPRRIPAAHLLVASGHRPVGGPFIFSAYLLELYLADLESPSSHLFIHQLLF